MGGHPEPVRPKEDGALVVGRRAARTEKLTRKASRDLKNRKGIKKGVSVKKLSKNGKIVSIKDSAACRAMLPDMVKRVRPVTLSASLRPVR
jgi:hypothetical protein